MKFIPVTEPDLSGNELRNLTECIESTWIASGGKFVLEFEQRFAEYCGMAYGLATSNGTVSLHLAMLALGIGPGDEVIVPDLTFAASANAVIYAGATPVFADVDPRTWNVSPERVEELITEKTKGILIVHLYGNPCDMGAFLRLKEKYGLALIEDAAQAHGATYRGRKAGSFGDISSFSFFGNKTITCGEGGICLTSDRALLEQMQVLRDHGMSPTQRYWHEVVGYNYRMTNLQAAVGVAQLERIDWFRDNKIRIAERYRALLDSELFTFAAQEDAAVSTNWLSSILLPAGTDRAALIARLRERGVDSRPFFYPMHEMPPYQAAAVRPFPVTAELSARGLSLPSGVTLTDEQLCYIADQLHRTMAEFGPSVAAVGTVPA